jgi:hypothetical protein
MMLSDAVLHAADPHPGRMMAARKVVLASGIEERN